MNNITAEINEDFVAEIEAELESLERCEQGQKTATDDMPRQPTVTQRIANSIRSFANFSRLLRTGGALAMVAAMSVFLLQDWDAGNDAYRFYLLLGQTGLLAIAGFALSFLLKENKSARVFFGLCLISIAANFTTLGALIYSVIPWDSSLATLPQFASWQVFGIGEIGIAAVAGLIIAIPVSLFSFTVLARASGRQLPWYFLFANCLLLLPVRESFVSALVILLGVVIPLLFMKKLRSNHAAASTAESCFASLVLFAPLLILLVRNFYWYDVSALLQVTMAIAGYVALRITLTLLEPGPKLKRYLEWLCLFVAGVVAILTAGYVVPSLSGELLFSVIAAIFALLAMDICGLSTDNKVAYASVAAVSLSLGNVAQILLAGGVAAALVAIISGLAVLLIAHRFKMKWLLILGAATLLTAFTALVLQANFYVDFGNWVTLAMLGVSAIISASVIERYGPMLKHKWSVWEQDAPENS